MPQLPPGPAYILYDVVPYILFISTATFTALTVIQRLTDVSLPNWVYVAAIVVQPWAKASYRALRDRRAMAARGAIPIPRVEAGSTAIINRLVETFSSGYPGEAYWAWALQYGNTFVLDVFSEKRVVTMEPEHVKAVLATQFNQFEKASLLLSQWKDLLGTGVFNADGDMWRFHRNMTRPFFSKDRISDFDNFERHAAATIALMKARLREGHPVEFQDVASRFTLDSATEFLFENHPSNIFVQAFIKGQEAAAQRTRYGNYWKLQEFWANGITEHRAVVDQFVEPIVEKAFARQRGGLADKETDADLVSSLVREMNDVHAIKDELLNILVAARDTTASLITFGMYALTRNPAITKRLRDEIASIVGDKAPTSSDIRDMKYLRAFLNETLRLYPPVPFDSRTSNTATTLPNKNGRPYYVGPHTKVIYALFWIHRREDLWGPTSLEFDPDRFIDERLHKYLTHNPFIFMPFNAGPRICLGQQFAYNEASYFFVRLLQNFSAFSIAEEEQARPPKEWVEEKVPGSTKDRDTIMFNIHLTMFAKGGLWLNMSEESVV